MLINVTKLIGVTALLIGASDGYGFDFTAKETTAEGAAHARQFVSAQSERFRKHFVDRAEHENDFFARSNNSHLLCNTSYDAHVATHNNITSARQFLIQESDGHVQQTKAIFAKLEQQLTTARDNTDASASTLVQVQSDASNAQSQVQSLQVTRAQRALEMQRALTRDRVNVGLCVVIGIVTGVTVATKAHILWRWVRARLKGVR